MRDTYHNLKFVTAIAPVTISDNTPIVGAIISHANFQSLTYAIQTGTLAGKGFRSQQAFVRNRNSV